MNVLYPQPTSRLPTFKKRFINEMPQLINYPISIDVTDDIISIMYRHNKINICIQITTDYPWRAPLILLNNIEYTDYIKSNLFIKNLSCSDNNILYSNYIKSNIYNIYNISGGSGGSGRSDGSGVSNTFNEYYTYPRYNEHTTYDISNGYNGYNRYNRYNKCDKSNERFICLFCKSITNRINWYPTRRINELIDETKKFIDYKQNGVIRIILRVIKRKYLVNDIPLEDFMNYKLVL
jgi:hypothetical protein